MQQKRRTGTGLTLALVAVAALTAGCSTQTDQTSPTAPPTTERTTETPVPPGLQPYLDQTLTFGPCDPEVAGPGTGSAECALLDVPLDHDSPEGRTIRLGVSRIAASDPDRLGAVVVNPGGPGQSGVAFAPVVAAVWAGDPGLARFDVIGLDPRGVGMSEPAISCYTTAQRDDDAITTALPPGGLSWTADGVREVREQCAAAAGGEEVLAHLGTRDVVRDLDILRTVLDEEKLSFFGASYGTRLGAVYAETYPENVRALVLDGAVDPRKDDAQRQVQLFSGLQGAFDRFAAFCAEQGECPLGDDPAGATVAVQELLRPLVDEPLLSATGRELTFYKAVEGIVVGLYSAEVWPAVIGGLTELRAGHPEVLLALRDLYSGRSETGEYAAGSEAGFVINCIDERQLTAAETTALVAAVNDAAPFLDPGFDAATEYGCAGWPTGSTLDFPYATDIDGLPQTLVVSTTGDGLTPHEGGIALAEALGASLLTVDGDRHGSVISGNSCVTEVVSDYLVRLELPEPEARCTL